MRTFGLLTRRPEPLPAGVQVVDKTALMRESDVIVLCCPLTPQTRGLIEQGFRAVKLRVGDGPQHDVARVQAVRMALGR